jgi:endo-1,4-beta-xylanase
MLFMVTLFFVTSACAQQKADENEPTLKDTFKDHFYIGAAVNRYIVEGNDSAATELLVKQFNSITAENDHKWALVHPEKGKYNFEPGDKLMELGKKNNMSVIGHTLIWHSQTPRWVFQDDAGNDVSKDTLLARMKEHIFTVAGHYKEVHGWDVLNEAVNDDGSMRQSKWLEIAGGDFIEKIFTWAHEANPEAELYYNDYNMWYEGKRNKVVEIARNLQAKGIRIDGIGMQGHWGLDYPDLAEAEASILAFAELGLKVHITELDVQMLPRPDRGTSAEISQNFELQAKLNPYKDGLPDSMKTVIANRYAEIFQLFNKHKDKIARVTLWGLHNGMSWHNNWPVRGRTAYPLLFDRDYKPVPAFYEVLKTAGR